MRAGIGLRAQHHEEILARRPAIGWLEAHSENYFARGGAQCAHLERIREHYELSLHGVGLSLGSTDPLNAAHLREVKRLMRDFEPLLISEHLSWSSVDGRYLNDLLPLPYTEEALQHLIARVSAVQDALGVQILIENISSYLRYQCAEVPEWEFLTALARQSGCAILLDVNNLYVNASNHGFDPHAYLHGIPRPLVRGGGNRIRRASFSISDRFRLPISSRRHGVRINSRTILPYSLSGATLQTAVNSS